MNANSNISINPNLPQYEDFYAEIDGKLILSSSSVMHPREVDYLIAGSPKDPFGKEKFSL